MLLEPPRSRISARAGPSLLNARRIRVRARVVDAAPEEVTPLEPVGAPAPSPPVVEPPVVELPALPAVQLACLAAAAVLAIASRGDVFVLALLLGFGSGLRRSGVAAATALVAACVRWGSTSLGAIAGAQAVLGPAGWTGSNLAVASAWLAAVALVLAAAPIAEGRLVRVLSSVPFACAAADVAIGPGPGGAIALRALATVVAVALASLVPRVWGRDTAAIGCGVAALVCAALAR